MSFLLKVVDFFLHLDHYLALLIQMTGHWAYVVLFFVIFCETGLVVTPFLPGDSLLFAVGSFSALGSLSLPAVLGLLWLAAVLGDTTNYWIGHTLGLKVFDGRLKRFFKKEYYEKAHAFYQKHGAKMIVFARFVPIVRTFAPFVAGVARMEYKTFAFYNLLGATIWVGLFVMAGYWFGNIPVVRERFTLVIFAIIGISLLPPIIEYFASKRASKDDKPASV